MTIYFGYLDKDDSTFNRILYVAANSEEDARQKVESKLKKQNRIHTLTEWITSGKLIGIKMVSSE